jgi:hypothetical protein
MSKSFQSGPQAAADPSPKVEQTASKVGYKSPPASHRWRPGVSGNPNGRPRGAKSISTILGEELDKDIEARCGGRLVKMSRRRALVQKQVELALKGDARAFMMILKLDPVMAREIADEAKSANDERRVTRLRRSGVEVRSIPARQAAGHPSSV